MTVLPRSSTITIRGTTIWHDPHENKYPHSSIDVPIDQTVVRFDLPENNDGNPSMLKIAYKSGLHVCGVWTHLVEDANGDKIIVIMAFNNMDDAKAFVAILESLYGDLNPVFAQFQMPVY